VGGALRLGDLQGIARKFSEVCVGHLGKEKELC